MKSKFELAIDAVFNAIYEPYEAILKRIFGENSGLYLLFLVAPFPCGCALCFPAYIVISEIMSK
jgi:hypothetical protein